MAAWSVLLATCRYSCLFPGFKLLFKYYQKNGMKVQKEKLSQCSKMALIRRHLQILKNTIFQFYLMYRKIIVYLKFNI